MVNLQAQDDMLNLIPNLVNEAGNKMLMAAFSKEEIQNATFSLGANKAPGPDGFQIGFFPKVLGCCG